MLDILSDTSQSLNITKFKCVNEESSLIRLRKFQIFCVIIIKKVCLLMKNTRNYFQPPPVFPPCMVYRKRIKLGFHFALFYRWWVVLIMRLQGGSERDWSQVDCAKFIFPWFSRESQSR